MSDRFYTSEPLVQGDFTLEGADAHHLAQVRRFQIGDHVTMFNGDGFEYPTEVVSIEKKRVHLRIISRKQPQRELRVPLHIGSALPKGDRGDFLIEKLTELGVTDFTPLETSRSVVHPKLTIVEKWNRAVIEASKQCGRNVLLRVHPPCRFEKWIDEALPLYRWIAQPTDEKIGPMTVDTGSGIAAAIGPEGGFTVEEVALAIDKGFVPMSLGPRILRVETAAIAIASIVGAIQ